MSKKRRTKRNSRPLRAVRLACLHEQGWACKFCKEPLVWRTATLDHVIPKARFGPGDRGQHWRNCVAACWECNNIRDDMPFYDFVRSIARDEPPADQLLPVWMRRRRNLNFIETVLETAG